MILYYQTLLVLTIALLGGGVLLAIAAYRSVEVRYRVRRNYHWVRDRIFYALGIPLGRRRHRRFGDLNEDAEFDRLTGEPAPLMEGDLPKQVFAGRPHDYVKNLQRRTAQELLVLVGAKYLPGRLKLLLKRFDAFQATARFLNLLGLEYSELLKNQDQRDLLNRLLGYLVEADEKRKDSGLSEIPLYDVLKSHDMAAIEKSVDRLRVVAELRQSFGEEGIVFQAYQTDFYAEALRLTREWADLQSREVNLILDTWARWQELQERYKRVNTEIDGRIEVIKKSAQPDSGEEQLRRKIRDQVRFLRARIEASSLEPNRGIKKLEGLLLDLHALARKVRRERDSRAWSAYRRRRAVLTRKEVRERLVVLGLTSMDALDPRALRRAYHQQAMRHHPDRGGDSDRFAQIHQAYDELVRHLKEQKLRRPARPRRPPRPERWWSPLTRLGARLIGRRV